jgi:hypothetical protein
MSDRYYIKLACAYCGEINPNQGKSYYSFWEDDYFSFSESPKDFICWKCGKKNKITQKFVAEKAEKEKPSEEKWTSL